MKNCPRCHTPYLVDRQRFGFPPTCYDNWCRDTFFSINRAWRELALAAGNLRTGQWRFVDEFLAKAEFELSRGEQYGMLRR